VLTSEDIVVLADDLTGACDVAARFSPVWGEVPVHVVGPDCADGPNVLNLQARLLSPERCRRMASSLKNLRERAVVFVKIDTALRGSVGALLEGLLEATGPRATFVAPAMPSIGRTTRDGIQYADGRPIHRTAHAADVASPVHDSSIADILRATGRCEVEVCDAESDGELAAIVDRALSAPPVMLVGSLGLAQALCDRLLRQAANPPDIPVGHRPMIICGSAYPAARRQMQRAAQEGGASVVQYDPSKGLPPAPGGDGPLILALGLGQRTHTDCARVMGEFMTAVTEAMARHSPDALGVIGGETAFAVLKGLGCRRLAIRGWTDEVVATGRMMDGAMAGAPFASKGGSVGGDDSVLAMLKYLKNPQGNRSEWRALC
jgi:uncharacterized protein YgbK (DUF1537 family)